jgi:ribonucleoside-diphosphate reductase beta chain
MALLANPNRFVLFPIKYKELWDFYKKAESCFWTAEELDLESDKRDWAKLNYGQKLFIETVLAFFAASDGIVNENLGANFFSEVQIPEARCFYGFQIAMENIHAETYSLLIETYVETQERRQQLFEGLQTFESIRAKGDWALKWTDKKKSTFGERLVAFACVEGIAFSSSFCAIFYLKKQGLMCHGLGKSNELISRDEGLHRDFACALFKILGDDEKPPTAVIHQIITECVDVEKAFVSEALPVSLIGMNAEQMQNYVKFVADSLCVALQVPKIYLTPNPFEWMEQLSLQGKTNFFESRVTEYAKAGVGTEDSSLTFSLNEDF